jgi:lipopolysaccharide/colanic/teichoic acid biosynthesis glycosyltransferase
MSFIGPRPLLERYLAFYTPEERRRHRVRPGLTGWAQIHGRNELPWRERLALDTWYVDHVSFALDARIAWRTLWKTLRGRGVVEDPSAAMLDLDQERQTA